MEVARATAKSSSGSRIKFAIFIISQSESDGKASFWIPSGILFPCRIIIQSPPSFIRRSQSEDIDKRLIATD